MGRSRFESPEKFVQALIYQLARFDSSLGTEIAKALEGNALHLPLSHQLQSLFIHPLRIHQSMVKEQTQIVVLIDGLDECMEKAGGSDAFCELLSVLPDLTSPNTFHSFPFLRLIVASRPEEPIHRAFAGSSGAQHVLHLRLDTSSPETTADIHNYLTVKFAEIFRESDDFRRTCERENVIERLAKLSHGLFIWAAIVFRFLRDFPRPGRLQLALNMNTHRNARAAVVLNELYGTVFCSVAGNDGNDDNKSHICTILGLVMAVGRLKTFLDNPQLTETILHGLVGHVTDNVDDILSLLPRLGAVIEGAHSPDAELVLIHKSLDDYFTDESRAKEPWYIDVKGCWIPELAECCVQMVSSNVFSDTPETSEVLSFAHHYWVYAFNAQLDEDCPFPTECQLSRILLKVLRQGLLRWVYSIYRLDCYLVMNRTYNPSMDRNRMVACTVFGFNSVCVVCEISLCDTYGTHISHTDA
ncbi:hypothetical protein V5O48_014657 [Marasmius crinis-equi]|uniref:Nephrocystin 3-like N-terminal domain-containing protein n=1 Tax=Marasmius crinis-equi TaxID=585013 RepID=A0ABR3EWN4_9AGAR